MTGPAPEWRKSSFSYANGDCVEVAAAAGGWVLVRDSRKPHGPVLEFTASAWAAFTDGIKAGEFDRPAS